MDETELEFTRQHLINLYEFIKRKLSGVPDEYTEYLIHQQLHVLQEEIESKYHNHKFNDRHLTFYFEQFQE